MAYVEALTGTDIEFGKTLWQSLRANRTFPTNGVLLTCPPFLVQA
jgi:hypothetical protein